jgi:hypothetical protein
MEDIPLIRGVVRADFVFDLRDQIVYLIFLEDLWRSRSFAQNAQRRLVSSVEFRGFWSTHDEVRLERFCCAI